MKRLTILFILIAPSLSAPDPNGCIEACLTQRLMGLQNVNQRPLDYSRPGNWSEHNQYLLNGGGRVHEEHGQYVDGSKQMRYFKKNYTSSYGSGDTSSLSNDHLSGNYGFERASSDNTYGSRRQSLEDGQRASYLQSQAVSTSHNTAFEELNRLMEASQNSFRQASAGSKLEDFGHSENILLRTDQNHIASSRPRSRSEVMVPKAGGGHEKVFEEQGQVQTGPTHIKYYKKNYTSSYSSHVPGVVSTTGFDDLQTGFHNANRQTDSLGRDTELLRAVPHTSQDRKTDDRLTSENSQYRSHYDQRQTSYGSGYLNSEDYQHRAVDDKRVPSSYGSGQRNLDNVSTANEQVNSYESSRRIQQAPATTSQENYRRVHGQDTYRQVQYPEQSYHTYDNRRRVSTDRTRESESLREDTSMHGGALIDADQRRGYQNIVETIPTTNRAGQIKEYEEHRSHSSHYKERTVPHYTSGAELQSQQLANSQLVNQQSHHQSSGYARQSSYYNQGRNTYVGQSSVDNTDPIYRTPSDKLVVGTVDMGQGAQNVDCTGEEAGHVHHQYSSQYHRRN